MFLKISISLANYCKYGANYYMDLIKISISMANYCKYSATYCADSIKTCFL